MYIVSVSLYKIVRVACYKAAAQIIIKYCSLCYLLNSLIIKGVTKISNPSIH